MQRRAFLWLLVSGGAAASQTTAQLVAPRESTVVVLLGTGMPRPDPEASGPATAIVVGERVFLRGRGPGRRAAARRRPPPDRRRDRAVRHPPPQRSHAR